MAIKTRPMPKLYCSYFAKNPETMVDKGNLSEWSYTYNKSKNIYYLNEPSYKPAGWTTLYVPWVNGQTIVSNYDSMFKENKNVTFVDFQYVPSGTNSLYMAFWGCYNIAEVRNINNNVTNMSRCFEFIRTNVKVKLPPSVTNISSLFTNAYKLNRSVKIPDKVTDMNSTFSGCTIFNQPINIPSKVRFLGGTFSGCSRFNQPITIPSSVTGISHLFRSCANFNQSITVPNKVTDMSGTFYYCTNLNAPITVGNKVTTMYDCFEGCSNFASTVTIYSTEITNGYNAFTNTNKSKTVRIYYEYTNGVKTNTYNTLVTNSTHKWHKRNGVTVTNMGRAPW